MAGKQLSTRKRAGEPPSGGLKQARLSGVFEQKKPTTRSALRPNNEMVRLLGSKDAAAQAAKSVRRQSYGLAAPDGVRQLRSREPTPAVAPKAAAAKGKASEAAKAAPKAAAKAAAKGGKSAAGSKGSKGGRAAAAAKAQGRRRQLSEATLDGETFHVGDAAYVVLDTDAVAACLDAGEEEECACVVCGGTDKAEAEAGPLVMLECDRCLSGCHMGCCAPPLQEVPEGEWVCPDCAGGRSPQKRRAATARELFLQRQGLGLARIEALWQEPDGELEAALRWYEVPEGTHTGRQRHHLAREVFLLQTRDVASLSTLLRPAHVLAPREFQASGSSGLGEDVYVCEYLYDAAWQRFRRRTEFDSESEDEGEEWAPGGGASDSEDDDDDMQGLEAEHGGKRRGGGQQGGGGGGGINRRKGLVDYLAQVGALAVPERARARGPQSTLAQARSALTLAAVPRSLPCREAERAAVTEFVEQMLEEDGGKCLYVSGIPGTGKTATVLEVMRAMKRRSEAGEVVPFQFVELNGLRLPSPQHAYSALYEALTGDRAGPQAAAAALEELFSSGGGRGGAARRPTIVLVDEMDLLVNKTQSVLYNLFDWPGRQRSRLSIIGIANTMDLPERLHPRIGSRLAGHRIVFQPYTKDQLQTIIRSRLEGVAAFQPNAVQFMATRIANNSGDVRRCLELGRRAAEIAEEQLLKQQRRQAEQQQQQPGAGGSSGSGSGSAAASGSRPAEPVETGMVEMRHVGAAIAEMFSTGHVRMLREASRLERLLLAAIYIETTSSGRAECMLADAAERLRVLCTLNCENERQKYDFGAVVERAAYLGDARLIICDPAARRVRTKVALNVAANDLLMVLNADPDMPWLEAALSRASQAPVAPDLTAA